MKQSNNQGIEITYTPKVMHSFNGGRNEFLNGLGRKVALTKALRDEAGEFEIYAEYENSVKARAMEVWEQMRHIEDLDSEPYQEVVQD